MTLQLDLFLSPKECEIADLRKNQNVINATLEKVRRGTYAELNQLKKVCVELAARQEIIERNICQK